MPPRPQPPFAYDSDDRVPGPIGRHRKKYREPLFVIRFAPGLADRLARLALALLATAAVSSCGSGAVSGSAPVNDPARITILPATATAFSGLPTTFVISGGTGSYIVSSSNQAIVQVAGSLAGNTLTIIPNPVIVDTTVTLTVRDTGSTPTVQATVTVRPGTVSNSITITPSSTQAAACAPALCSGGDAVVSATISQGGIPLAARGVRFEVVSGDFRFINTDPASGVETLSTSISVVSDETGKASARLRATAGAANQTALLQVTDVGTGAFQRTSFLISQSTGSSPGFFVTPTQITFQGIRVNECATGISANVFVFGGAPPYTVSSTSSAFIISRDFISFSGGSYTVTPNGECVGVPGAPIIVRDASGNTATTTVANIPGTQATPALAVTPSTVTLSSCTGSANVTVAGGRQSNYFVSSGSDSLIATVSGNTVTITRRSPSPASTGPLTVGISDGTTVVNVTVNLTGSGAGTCPSPGLAATPQAVALSDCSGVAQVTLSGGAGAYSVASSNSSVIATVSGNIVSIRRANPSGAFTGATVTATDGTSSVPITVTGSGAGANACPTSSAFTASSSTVTLNDCTGAAQVVLSGGSGTYSAASGNTGMTATVSGNILSIKRTVPSGPFTGGNVTASDGFSNISITVNWGGASPGTCP